VYRPVPRQEIADAVTHLRELFRASVPANDEQERARERREVVSKNLLSNLPRMKAHPTLNTILEIADVFSLTLDGAHRLFGYDLESIREYDVWLNSGRTRIIESYPFERDLPIDLPLQLGDAEVFQSNSALRELVSAWQTGIPIRALNEAEWHQPGVFYIQVGTEDSLGSSLPPGAIALVEPITEQERLRPNPRVIYLLQFGNGYRCSRCVSTRGKLLLLTAVRNYAGPQEFSYPGGVRIAGRIRVFAVGLPIPEYPLLGSLPLSSRDAPLILPWEHTSISSLFAAKYRRFSRPRQERPHIQEMLQAVFQSKVSGRTERRYRRPTPSQPHVDALIQLALTNVARYTDSLRVQRVLPSDRGRFSLDTLLNASHLNDLPGYDRRAQPPIPRERWAGLRRDYVEWPMLLSLKFPQLRSWEHQVVRLPQGSPIDGLNPAISPGSLLLLEEISGVPAGENTARGSGWARPLYALRRGAEVLCGYLDRSGSDFALFTSTRRSDFPITFRAEELSKLSRIAGVAVPV
jgi:hypothetical protein